MPEPTVEYKYNSIQELDKEANNPSMFMNRELKIESFNKLYREAILVVDRNPEKAYIYFFRCFELVKHMKKSLNFDKDYCSKIIGADLQKTIEFLVQLKTNLEKVYEDKKLKRENQSIISKRSQETKKSKIISSTEENGSHSIAVHNTKNIEVPVHKKKTNITCLELNEIAKKCAEHSILVIDLRLKSDFDESRMNVPSLDIINVPENHLEIGQTPKKIEIGIEERFQPYFRRRNEYERIVLLDWFSTEESCLRLQSDSPVYRMNNILDKWDYKVKYKHKLVILEGGYEEWISRYPNYSTNAKVSPPTRRSINNGKISLENINYPTTALLEPEKLEIKPIPAPEITKPSFDRSTKPVLQEKKTEIVKENGISVDNVEKKVTFPEPIVPVESSEEERRDSTDRNSFDEEEEKLKNNYFRSGRRSALTSLSNQPPVINSDGRYDSEDDADDIEEAYRNEEKENNMNSMKTLNSGIQNDIGSGMKRYSSTPNIPKIENEYNRPPIDRSTKPSNDNQPKIFSHVSSYYADDEGRGLTGLLNIGNTCYMNSILQCLSNTKSLRDEMIRLQSHRCNNESKTRGRVAKEISDIFRQLWTRDHRAISCSTLKHIVGEYRDTFKGSEQQDSHEFLTILIDWLHEDLNKPEPGRSLKGADEKSGEKAWGEFINKNNSIIRELFYGQQKSTVSCNDCKKQSVTFEPFSNLSLPLPSSEKCTLAECLRLYTSNESIFGWQCPDCKCPRAATKKLDITKLPPILVIHFKRFTSDGWCRKRVTNVDFPNKLDMAPYLIGHEHRNREYELYAVSNHMGTMETGHYTAFCRNSENYRWYKFDDDNVISINSENVPKSSSAYIVFYQCLFN